MIALSNEECAEWLGYNATRHRVLSGNIKNELNNTLPPNLLCTKGIYNQERKVFSVSGR